MGTDFFLNKAFAVGNFIFGIGRGGFCSPNNVRPAVIIGSATNNMYMQLFYDIADGGDVQLLNIAGLPNELGHDIDLLLKFLLLHRG